MDSLKSTGVITSDHITYMDSLLPKELDNSRLWFINKMRPMNDYDWHNAKMLSVFWFYKQMLGCEYNAAVERKIRAVSSK